MFNFILRITSVGILLHMLVSFRLWLPDRFYPKAEIITLPTELVYFLEIILFFVALTYLAQLIVIPRDRLIKKLILILLIYFALDLGRLHAALYQYLLIFILAIQLKNNKEVFYSLIVVFLSATYFWSGFQKINFSYLNSTASYFLSALPDYWPSQISLIYGIILFFSPIIEGVSGIGLFFVKTRKLAVIILITMHLVILATLISHNYNQGVWPWNCINILLLCTVYMNNSSTNFKKIFVYPISKLICILTLVIPILGFSNLVDQSFSFNLYTARNYQLIFFFNNGSKALLDQRLHFLTSVEDKTSILDMNNFSDYELKVSSHDSFFVLEKTAKDFCKKLKKDPSISYVIYFKPGVFDIKKNFIKQNCRD